MELIVQEDKPVQLVQESLKNLPKGAIPFMPEIHRVEFINWKDCTVCNVMVKGSWRTCQFPITTTIIEFLMAGSLYDVYRWRRGRIYREDPFL